MQAKLTQKLAALLIACAIALPAAPQSKADKAAVLAALKPKARTACAYDINLKPQTMRFKNGWCFIICDLIPIKKQPPADGEAVGLLKKVGKKWVVVDWTVGSSYEDVVEEMRRAKGLPSGLIPPNL